MNIKMQMTGRMLRKVGAGWTVFMAGLLAQGAVPTAPIAAETKTEPPAGVMNVETPASDPVAAAWAALARGSQRDAEAILAQAALVTPNSAPVLFWKAVCIRSRFQIGEAGEAFAQVIARAPESPEAVASACMQGIDFSKDWGSALHYYQCLLALETRHPENDGILWLTAMTPRALERFTEMPDRVRGLLTNHGVDAYRELLERFAPKKGPVLVHQTLANLLDERGDAQAALRYRETAVRLERATWSMHGCALTLDNLGLHEEAAQMCRDTLAVWPAFRPARQTLGTALWQGGHPAEAFAAWDAVRGGASAANLTYYGRCALEAGEWARAWDYLSAAQRLSPADRTIKILQGRAAVHTGLPGASERLAALGLVFNFKGQPESWKTSEDPWFRAVVSGDLAAIRRLAATEDINRRDGKHQSTALMQAAQNGWVEVVAELLERKADIDLSDLNGSTALHYACDFNQPGSVRLLLAAGAKLEPVDVWKQTPLINAISSGCTDGVRQLIAKGADVSAQTGRGDALAFAVGNGARGTMKLLLEKGADVNATVPGSRVTALMALCRDQRQGGFVRLLLESGADAGLRDRDGRTALHYAIAPSVHTDLVNALLTAGCDPRLASAEGITAITKARALGWEEFARKMEGNTPEPFSWPVIPELDDGREAMAAAFTWPVRYASEATYDQDKGAPWEDKYARKELRELFGVTNAAGLRAALERLARNGGYTAVPVELPGLDGYFRSLAETAFLADGEKAPRDDQAWLQAHRIYLAQLGVIARYLPEAEGRDIVKTASAEIVSKFKDWREFSASFLAGVEQFEGWNRSRYEHLCERLAQTRWAAKGWPSAAGSPTHPAS